MEFLDNIDILPIFSIVTLFIQADNSIIAYNL